MARRARVVALGLLGTLAVVAVIGFGTRERPSTPGEQKQPPTKAWLYRDEPRTQAASIEGTVTSPDGRSVDGAVVVLVRAPLANEAWYGVFQPAAQAVSAGGGRFRFGDVRPGSYAVTATAAAAVPAESPTFELPPGATKRLALVLGAGGFSLDGCVLDDGGGPIGRARVVVVRGVGGNPSFEQPRRVFVVSTDDDGRFRLVLPRGEFVVRAEASGYAPHERPIALIRPTTHDFRLQPAARIHGRVVERETKRPVPEAEVWTLVVGEFSGGGGRTIRADAEGRFSFDDLTAGYRRVGARRGALVGFSPPVAAVATDAVEVEVQVSPARTVEGRVVDAAGAGAPGVSVSLTAPEPPYERRSDGTDADGRFEIQAVLPARYRVAAESGPRGRGVLKTVDVTRVDVRGLTLKLGAAATVAGTVSRPDGKPAAGAIVRLTGSGRRGPGSKPVIAGADGTFRIVGAGPEKYAVVADGGDGGIAREEIGLLVEGEEKTVALRLAAGGSIRGTTKFQDGSPARAIAIAVTGQGEGLPYRATISDEAGAFSAGGLAPGTYTVWGRRKAPPHNISTSRPSPDLRIVTIMGAETNDTEITLKSGGKAIGGVVQMPDGKPAAGVTVIAAKPDGPPRRAPSTFWETDFVTTHQDGAFVIDDIEDGTLRLWAVRPGFPDVAVDDIAAGRKDVKITLRPGGVLAGVVSEKDGQPTRDFVLALMPGMKVGENDRDRRMRADAARHIRIHDPEGGWEIGALQPGPYEVKVSTAAGGVASRLVTLSEGEQNRAVDLTVEPGIVVRGKVVELETGAPLAEATATLRGGARSIEATAGADGSFEVVGFSPGDVLNIDVRPTADTHISEFTELQIPPAIPVVDAGVFRLMRGQRRSRMSGEAGTIGLRSKVSGGRFEVSEVQAGSAAEKAGLEAGDVVVAVDGKDVRGIGQGAIRFLMSGKPGTRVTLGVQSTGGEPRNVPLTLEAYRPAPPRK